MRSTTIGRSGDCELKWFDDPVTHLLGRGSDIVPTASRYLTNMSLFATSLSTTRRGASTLLPTASAVASSSSSRLPTPAPVYAQARPFSGSSTRYGKSRPGEGKDAKKAARRAERLKKDGVLDGAVTNVDESYTLEEAVRVLKVSLRRCDLDPVEDDLLSHTD